MAEKLLMMALSPTMSEGVIAKWNIPEGASFKAGSLLCEVETDKASMDYEAPKDSVLLKIIVPAGGKAAVGDPIAIIGAAGEDPLPLAASAAAPPERPAPGPERPAPEKMPPSAQPAPAAASQPASGGPGRAASYPPSSPLARTIARELGVDLRDVRGTGPGGRVVEKDVRAMAAAIAAGSAVAAGSVVAYGGVSALGGAGPASPASERRVAVSGKRAVIARRLAESFFTAPHFYLKRRVDVGELFALREAANRGREKPISLNAFLIKLCAEAIKRHQALNSGWQGDSIVERSAIDIGLAVALPDGLITPVARDCGRKGVAEIEEEMAALIAKAKAKGLVPGEYEGAGFTISNLGSFGVEEFTAIINPPGSAILAVGAALLEPCVKGDGSLGTRRAMALTLGCDHRVVDGAAGAAFLADLVAFVEDPGKALL
jgi:pyruvate dehydrogenase E2 component (dihydrolipoamide acetyltransferase)